MNKTNMKYIFPIFVLFMLFSCSSKNAVGNSPNSVPKDIVSKDSVKTRAFFSEEIFEDSLNIGRKGFNKVTIEKFRSSDDEDGFVLVQFFELSDTTKNKWLHLNKFYFDSDSQLSLSPEIKDLNNDGFMDFTYQSLQAARGSNEVRKLFIYDAEDRNFTYMKNSENYPNLYYNKELNNINSFIFSGSTRTAFLRIKKDSLQEFASVDVSDSVYVEELQKNGKMKVIFKGKYNGDEEDRFVPYKNYKPLKLDN